MNNQEQLIVLSQLRGNEPAVMTPLQQVLAPHADVIIFGWAVVLFVTLLVVFVRGIVMPLVRKL